MEPDGEQLLALLESSGALQRGHFHLSSGLHSDTYVQCALLLEDPARAARVGEVLGARLAEAAPESVMAPALGGIVLGHEVARSLATPFRFSERGPDGVMRLRRGFRLAPGERVVVVEDVVTTGRSTLEVIALARADGAEVVAVGSLIDRTGGRHPFDVPYHALLRLELETYPPAACPLCDAGSAAVHPGSRPARAAGSA